MILICSQSVQEEVTTHLHQSCSTENKQNKKQQTQTTDQQFVNGGRNTSPTTAERLCAPRRVGFLEPVHLRVTHHEITTLLAATEFFTD